MLVGWWLSVATLRNRAPLSVSREGTWLALAPGNHMMGRELGHLPETTVSVNSRSHLDSDRGGHQQIGVSLVWTLVTQRVPRAKATGSEVKFTAEALASSPHHRRHHPGR